MIFESSMPRTGRREALGYFSVLAATVALGGSPGQAEALAPCPSGSQNCQAKAWAWPKDSTKDDAVAELRKALEEYPQEGQDGVDGGGWVVVEDALDDKGSIKLEFRSSGKGNIAKFFNGGKPFVDDVEIAVEGAGVSIRSSSRVGDSDFGVNAKRVNFIAAKLRAKGWDASGVAK